MSSPEYCLQKNPLTLKVQIIISSGEYVQFNHFLIKNVSSQERHLSRMLSLECHLQKGPLILKVKVLSPGGCIELGDCELSLSSQPITDEI